MDRAPKNIDLILSPTWTIPVIPRGNCFHNYDVAINNGKIVSIHPCTETDEKFHAEDVIDLTDQVLIPGLVNAHTHAAMSLFRGYADDLPLMKWLSEYIWPAESEHVSSKFVYDGTMLACAEMIRSGTTCFNDMYFFPKEAGLAAIQAGLRAMLGITVIDLPTNYGTDSQDYLRKGLLARDELHSEARINFAMAPHSPYTVSNKSFEQIRIIADQLQLPIHLHIHETVTEVEDSIKQYGERPLSRLNKLGLLTPSLIGVHAVQVTNTELALLAQHGCSVAHCPTSNLKLASGFSPLGKIVQNGINVSIGTDGASSNNKLDMLAETRLAALLAKAVDGNASTFSAIEAIEAATIGGARALSLEEQIGSIEPGKCADLVSIKLANVETLPSFNVQSQLVYSCGRESVTNLWVNGNCLLRDRVLINLDLDEIIAQAKFWQSQLEEKGTHDKF